MEQATPPVRDLARRLLTLEVNESVKSGSLAALRVFEKLCASLSKLVGVAGFQALFSRALALARTEAEWLQAVKVKPDATLEGFSEAALLQSSQVAEEGGAILLAHLLGLLVAFIGEALTLRLVQDVWPGARLADRDSGVEENPA